MEPRILGIVDELIDGIVARGSGEMEFIRDFAYPLPALVIMELLRMPRERLDDFKRWSDELVLFVGGALVTEEKYARAERATNEMIAFFRGITAERRRDLGDDMVSALITAEDAGDVLNEEELIASCILLLFAGHETTKNLLANGLLQLIRNPAQAERLRADPTLAEAAVEEMLRIDGPSGGMVRVAREEVEMHGITIARGQRIYAMQHAANHDPAVFPDPDRFDIARANNRHITFGHGIHFCLGAPLARLEGKVAFPRLLQRLTDIELAAEPQWLDSVIFRGMLALPLRFRPAD
jgi:cytochrome P450